MLVRQDLLKRITVVIGFGVVVWALSRMIVFHFGLVQTTPAPVGQKLLSGVYPIVYLSLENLGKIIYNTMPFGHVEYIYSGQPRGLRLAVFSSFTLWEDSWPSVPGFIFRLGGLNAAGVLLVIFFRQRRPVNGAWIEFVRRKRAFLSLWFSALVVAVITIAVSNLAWMLWMKVHWIHRAATDVREEYVSQGETYTRVDMVSWTPMALGTIPIAAIAIGGIALYLVMTSLLLDRMANRGAAKLGLCGKCGYHRAGDQAMICPECGFDGVSFKSRSRVAMYLLCFTGCTMLLSAPLWMGWFAQYLHQGLYLYFAS